MDDNISDRYLKLGFRIENSAGGLRTLYYYQQTVFTLSSNINLSQPLMDRLCEAYLEAMKKGETEGS